MATPELLKALEEENKNVLAMIAQKRHEIHEITAFIKRKELEYEDRRYVINAVKGFDSRLQKALHTEFLGSKSNNESYSWQTAVNPITYFQTLFNIPKIDIVDGIAYVQSAHIGNKVFDLFVVMPTEDKAYRIDLVLTPQEKVFRRGFSINPDSWEMRILDYVGKRLPKEIFDKFHNIEDVVDWVRNIRHPELMVSYEPKLGVPCVVTFTGLRITCDGIVEMA